MATRPDFAMIALNSSPIQSVFRTRYRIPVSYIARGSSSTSTFRRARLIRLAASA